MRQSERAAKVRALPTQPDSSSGRSSGIDGTGPASGSAFAGDLTTLQPVFEAAIDALDSPLSSSACCDVLAGAQRIAEARVVINEAALERGEFPEYLHVFRSLRAC